MLILALNICIEHPQGVDKREYQGSKHFWRYNLELSTCITNVLFKDDDSIEITEDFIKELNNYWKKSELLE